jgi:hypothetical protein
MVNGVSVRSAATPGGQVPVATPERQGASTTADVDTGLLRRSAEEFALVAAPYLRPPQALPDPAGQPDRKGARKRPAAATLPPPPVELVVNGVAAARRVRPVAADTSPTTPALVLDRALRRYLDPTDEGR